MIRNRMRSLRWSALGAAALSLAGLATAAVKAPVRPAAKAPTRKLTEIPLTDGGGKARTLAEFRDSKALVLVFLGTGCPISNNYAEPLSRLSDRYQARGVQFVGVNSIPGEELESIARHAGEYGLSFSVFKDPQQELAARIGARVTPEAFVLDASRAVRYQGRIDDRYASRTVKRSAAKSRDLEQAIDAVLAGKKDPPRVTRAFGCTIPLPEKSAGAAKVSFHRDVLPILQESCQTCHRPGQIGPFSLLTYADAKRWADEIKAFTGNRQMPPWKAEPGHGEFQDSRRLPDAHVQTIAQWVDAGAPEGSPKDAPPAKEWKDDWMLGQPDLVLTMAEPFHVEATGEDIFRCFVLPTNLTEDKQVVAVEIRPSNPRVAHHVLNFLDTAGRGRALDAKDPGPGYSSGPGGIGFLPSGTLGGWAPGNFPRLLPEGVGMPIAKGSDLVIQMHYHKTGKPEVDQTRIGIHYAKKPIVKQLRNMAVTNFVINIPPGEARHEVRGSLPILADAHAIGITPHMHLLGRELKVTATLPDGTVKDMVWVKDWDYRWQDTYRYKEPVALPRGTRLDLVAYFDNSTNNPRNPSNPPRRVTFGEQTTDEMCFAFISFTRDVEPPGGGTPQFRLF